MPRKSHMRKNKNAAPMKARPTESSQAKSGKKKLSPKLTLKDQYKLAIGNFIIEFSQLEFAIKSFFCDRIDAGSPEFELFLSNIDTLKVVDGIQLLLTAPKDEKDDLFKSFLGGGKPWWEDTEYHPGMDIAIKRFKAINDERVKIVHGIWLPDSKGKFAVRKTPRGKYQNEKWYYENIQELDKLASDCHLVAQCFVRPYFKHKYVRKKGQRILAEPLHKNILFA